MCGKTYGKNFQIKKCSPLEVRTKRVSIVHINIILKQDSTNLETNWHPYLGRHFLSFVTWFLGMVFVLHAPSHEMRMQ